MINKRQKAQGKPLYTLSAYARGYEDASGERIKGVMLSAYHGSGDERNYVDIWVKGDYSRVSEAKDGSILITVKMLGFEWKNTNEKHE